MQTLIKKRYHFSHKTISIITGTLTLETDVSAQFSILATLSPNFCLARFLWTLLRIPMRKKLPKSYYVPGLTEDNQLLLFTASCSLSFVSTLYIFILDVQNSWLFQYLFTLSLYIYYLVVHFADISKIYLNEETLLNAQVGMNLVWYVYHIHSNNNYKAVKYMKSEDSEINFETKSKLEDQCGHILQFMKIKLVHLPNTN